MTHTDKLIRLRIQNVRVFEDVTLDLDGLTILIGENGAGKSTIMEVLDMFSQIPSDSPFVSKILANRTGGAFSLLRKNEDSFSVQITIQSISEEDKILYGFTVALQGEKFRVTGEYLVYFSHIESTVIQILERNESSARFRSQDGIRNYSFESVPANDLLLTHSRGVVVDETINRLLDCMTRIRVHAPFNVQTQWVLGRPDDSLSMRRINYIEPAESLVRLGANLSSVYSTLLSNMSYKERETFFERMKLVLGENFQEILQRPVDRGLITLVARFEKPQGDIPVSWLSDGQLSYLGHCAITKLEEKAALLCFDEIESHTHPNMLIRIIDDYVNLARHTNVLLATHSDLLLNVLDPRSCRIIVLSSEEAGLSTAEVVANSEEVAEYIKKFGGTGYVRQSGMMPYILQEKR